MGGQVILIVLATVFEMIMKQYCYSNPDVDPGLFQVYAWLISAAFEIPLKLYSFLRPNWQEVIRANAINGGVAIAGQVCNYVRWAYCYKYNVDPVIQVLNDHQNIHEIVKAHAAN